MPTETPHQSVGVGGEFQQMVGGVIGSDETISPTRQLHHVTGVATISTIVPPWPDFMGPIYLVADGAWGWDDSGNIATTLDGNVVIANNVYGFVYDRVDALWYPFSDTTEAGS
jgi:hypothetical protein